MRFVLVHGAFHGAWCWDRVIPEFESRGHSVVTVDLPGSGSRVSEVADLGGYRDAVVDHLESGDVLVGHSFGSLAISLAADAVPEEIAHLGYLNAKLPIEGRSMAAATRIDALFSGSVLRVAAAVLRLLPDGIAPVEFIDRGRALWILSERAAAKRFFHDCSPEVRRWTFGQLTPQQLAPMLAPVSLPNLWRSELPRSLIAARDDKVPNPVEKVADRLGVDPFWIDGSHSPMLSRPGECVELIIDSLKRPPRGPFKSS